MVGWSRNPIISVFLQHHEITYNKRNNLRCPVVNSANSVFLVFVFHLSVELLYDVHFSLSFSLVPILFGKDYKEKILSFESTRFPTTPFTKGG